LKRAAGKCKGSVRSAKTSPARKKATWLAGTLRCAAIGLVVLLLNGPTLSAEQTSATPADIGTLVEQGLEALEAGEYEKSLAALRSAMSSAEFQKADPRLRYSAFVLASHAAAMTDDNLSAHEYLVVATTFPQADGEEWIRRAAMATLLDKWDDAAASLSAVARKWPKAFEDAPYQAQIVNEVVHELGKRPGTRGQRLELLNDLFAAQYKDQYGLEPAHLWLMLATDALDRKDLRRAREVAKRIDHPEILVAMRIDRRFDPLTSKDGRTFDVQAAARRQIAQLEDAMKAKPSNLGIVVQYGYALYTVGKFETLLALADRTIAQVNEAPKDAPPFEDLDEQFNWIHNHKASALRALGRWDEAAATLAAWERSDRNRQDKVSQGINLGFFYNELGRPEDALKAVEGLDWARAMSPYGRTQCQYVRFQAYQQLGRKAEAEEIVAWMRKHQKDAPQTAQATLLEAGDADAAAALMISRLRDLDERGIALAQVQIYAAEPRTERQKKHAALWESFLARPDVAAEIAAVGRRDRFPIHSMEY
jgi:tetratricopeptide (TPR) repeat protein